jgi:hypothetical protein
LFCRPIPNTGRESTLRSSWCTESNASRTNIENQPTIEKGRKEYTMSEFEHITEPQQPEWAALAASARAAEWSSDLVLDPGDSHVKGESSLCVGDAA